MHFLLFKQKSHFAFSYHASRTTAPFDLIHTDVWGIAPTLSKLGYKFYITFINDYYRYTWIYFIRKKSEVYDVFKKLYTLIQTQFQKNIKKIRLDSGGEYTP